MGDSATHPTEPLATRPGALFDFKIIRVVVASPCPPNASEEALGQASALPAGSRLDMNDLEME